MLSISTSQAITLNLMSTNTDTSDQVLRLAADVLIDILENMEGHSE